MDNFFRFYFYFIFGFCVFLVHPTVALVLLPASVERFDVSCLRDFFIAQRLELIKFIDYLCVNCQKSEFLKHTNGCPCKILILERKTGKTGTFFIFLVQQVTRDM